MAAGPARRGAPELARCGGLKPTIKGTRKADRIVGTARRDVIQGGRGDDRIDGRGGNDVICGGAGKDALVGGPGADRLRGGTGADTLNGGSEADILSGEAGADAITGESGDDTATGGPGRDQIDGGEGGDTIGGGLGADRLDGGQGDNDVYGGQGADTITAGAGHDRLFGGPGADKIDAGDGNDSVFPDPESGSTDSGDPSLAKGEDAVVPHPSAEPLLGADADSTDWVAADEQNDTVDPGPGDDIVTGSPGDDTVRASAGDDRVDGGDGADDLEGGDGTDTLDGGEGADTIGGGDGADTVAGGGGADALSGGADADGMDGGSGNDTIDGGTDGDVLDGGEGNDKLGGGPGNDKLQGGAGQDDLHGDEGDDELSGGDDRDTADGGPGADLVTGGAGGDTLRGGPDDGTDGGDTIDGGDSVDALYGGGGADRMDGGANDDVVFGESGDDGIEGGSGYDAMYGGDGNDSCVTGELDFLCEARSGATENQVSADAPDSGDACDAWASPGGDDGAAGTARAPYLTVERLVNALGPGRTGCLAGGNVYEEPDFEFDFRGHGDPGNPAILRTAPGSPRATLKGRLWVEDGAHDLVLRELNLDGNNPLASIRGAGKALPSPTIDGDRIALLSNDITTARTATCVVGGSVEGFGIAEDLQIVGNRIHACGEPAAPSNPSGDHGVDLESTRNAVIANNYIYDNADKGLVFFADPQGSQVHDNVIDGNRIAMHFSGATSPGGDWIYPAGTQVYPDNNVVTNNVITNSTLALDDPDHWQVEGDKDWGYLTPPEPAGNLVDANCFYEPDSTKNLQHPDVAFTAGNQNLAGPDPAYPAMLPQPPGGPGYADRAHEDFRLSGDPNTCPRSYGPEDPPVVATGDAAVTAEGSAELGYSATDRTRSSGSSVRVEWGSARVLSASVVDAGVLGAGESRSGTVALAGLSPGETYRYRAVAESPSGVVYGELKTFTVPPPIVLPGQRRSLPAPRAGATANVAAHGLPVPISLPGSSGFVPLRTIAQIPIGSGVNATKAPLTLTTAASTTGTAVAEAEVQGGVFDLIQAAKGTAVTELALGGGSFARCPSRAARARASGHASPLVRKLRLKGKGPYKIRGRYAAASVRGTDFTVTDRCDGTLTKVTSGRVAVRDLAKRRTIVLKAGQSYLAKPERR